MGKSINSTYLKMLRRERGLKPVQLAKLMNLTPAYYTNKVEQKGIVSVQNLRILFEALQVSILDIFSILRYIPKEMRWHEVKRFVEVCEERGEKPNMVLAEFIRVYGQRSHENGETEAEEEE